MLSPVGETEKKITLRVKSAYVHKECAVGTEAGPVAEPGETRLGSETFLGSDS